MPAKTILICDDEAPMRELVRVVLAEDGYEFVEAADGLQCLELARELTSDLLVLDLMLPGMSGLEVVAAFGSDPVLARIPIVVMSAWDHMREEALAAGAARFVGKPFEPGELTAAVAELLVEAERAGRAGAQKRCWRR